MFNTRKLLHLIKHNLNTRIPDHLWKELYLRLGQVVAPIGHSRYTILLVKLKPYYGDITIENGLHEVVVAIPPSLESLDQVEFTSRFDHLPPTLQQDIKIAIQTTINRAAEQRKKREWYYQANQISGYYDAGYGFVYCS